MNSKCIYYVEGPCEQQLIAALKENPAKLIPGKINRTEKFRRAPLPSKRQALRKFFCKKYEKFSKKVKNSPILPDSASKCKGFARVDML